MAKKKSVKKTEKIEEVINETVDMVEQTDEISMEKEAVDEVQEVITTEDKVGDDKVEELALKKEQSKEATKIIYKPKTYQERMMGYMWNGYGYDI